MLALMTTKMSRSDSKFEDSISGHIATQRADVLPVGFLTGPEVAGLPENVEGVI